MQLTFIHFIMDNKIITFHFYLYFTYLRNNDKIAMKIRGTIVKHAEEWPSGGW